MPSTRPFVRILPVIAAIALMIPASAQAQVSRDTQEINAYVLTDAGVARYLKASEALKLAKGSMPSDCDDSDDSNGKSIDEMVAKLNTIPAARAAIQSSGMTTREYFVFTMSLFQTGMASWALAQPGGKLPPGVSMANVNFYRQHEAAMSRLGSDSESDECNGDGRDQESEDDPSE